VVVSWSVNPQSIVSREEHGTASLAARLEAARKCLVKGYKIGFHIDPMIWHEGWQESYETLVQEIASRFTPADIPYIGVGALRYKPEQKHMMRERFGLKSLAFQGEMFAGKDGKLRYDQNTRNQMFQTLLQCFRKQSPEWKVWLCMENNESWLSAFNASPREIPEVSPLFAPLPQPVQTEKVV
jgi:spore photoproduct lyase